MTRLNAARYRAISVAAALLAMPILAACQSGGFGLPAPDEPPKAELPRPKGEVIGNGDVRVAMLLPLSAPGNAAKIAGELKNAALLAMEDSGMETLQLVIKDTLGTPNGAVDAASEASAEGAALALGPLFAGNVTAVTGVLRPAGRPIIAFSSDSRVGGQGVYLASYLPQTIIDRTLSYAASAGQRDIIAILPNGGIGDIAETQIRKTLSRTGGRLVDMVRYDYNDASVEAAIEAIAPSVPEAQAIFIPDGGSTPGAIVNTMQRRGVSLAGKKLLGTGQWTSSDLKNPALDGAWFADTDLASISGFKTKYTDKYGEAPSAVAPLAYDAVALVSGIVRRSGATGINRNVIESRTGYSGYTGVFRFRPDGGNERGLAVYEISGDDLRIVSAAPKAFGPAN